MIIGTDGSNTYFAPCYNSEVCLENGTCAEGYVGDLCSECDPDYPRDLVKVSAFECAECLPQTFTILVIVCGSMVAGAALRFKIKDDQERESSKSLHSIFFKIFASALQMNALALSFAFTWDDAMVWLLGTQEELPPSALPMWS